MNESTSTLNLPELITGFYTRIAELKQVATVESMQNDVRYKLNITGNLTTEHFVDYIQLELRQWLGQTELTLKPRLTDMENDYLQGALYALAALADEIFMVTWAWEGQVAWYNNPLEETLYRSSFAGTELFNRIDRLLAQDGHDELDSQLASFYLLMLRLGFQGQFRGDDETISTIKSSLMLIIEYQADELICTEAYQGVRKNGSAERLAPIATWIRWIILGGVSYIATSTGIWFYHIWQFKQLMGL